jgi:hypothetical protein
MYLQLGFKALKSSIWTIFWVLSLRVKWSQDLSVFAAWQCTSIHYQKYANYDNILSESKQDYNHKTLEAEDLGGSCTEERSRMKLVAHNKLHANSFLLINIQKELLWFSLHHITRQEKNFVPLVMVTLTKEKMVLGTTSQHQIYCILHTNCWRIICRRRKVSVLLLDESTLFQTSCI